MKPAPDRINDARVICFTPIDVRHRQTGNCKQIVAGVVQGAAAGLAICQYGGDDACYLFGCDPDWNVISDTWHQTVDEAKSQAEFEYEGVSGTWQYPSCPTIDVTMRKVIASPWTDMEPIRVGDIPTGLGTPDAYVTVERNGNPSLRIDIYRARSGESSPFAEARYWGAYVAIGFGDRAFAVELAHRRTQTIELGTYFGGFVPCDSCLLVASADRLFRIDPDGSLKWKSDELGIDGVVVDNVRGGLIEGQGEWDPPGGWRPFQIDLESGKPAHGP